MRVLADRYELEEELGRGGMATVYRAHDRVLGRTVAVKVLAPQLASEEGFVKRFRREAQAAAGLNDPNVVSIFDHGADKRAHFIVMEFVEGKTLADVLHEEGPLAPERAAAIGAAVARALEAAHERGLVHRDVKPGNVLLTNGDKVKVADFGIARTIEGEALTLTGTVLGTASYISPEQARGEAVDARSDLYSLGCVLFEMLAGEPPFSADSPIATAHRHVSDEPQPPSALRSEVPPELDALTLQALSKSPGDRPASAGAMAAALGAIAGGDPAPTEVIATAAGAAPPTPTTPMPAITERRRWGWVAAAGAALLAVLLLLWLLPGGGGDRVPATEATASPEPSPEPEPEEEPLTVEDAYLALVTVVTEGLTRDEMTRKAAEEITKNADEALEEYRDGNLEDALKELDEARQKTAEHTEKGEIQPARAGTIMEAIDLLDQAMRLNPPPEPRDDDDDDDDDGGSSGKPGKGKGRGRGGGSSG